MAVDMGMSYGFKTLGKHMRMGASVTNLGQGMKYVNQKDSLPTAMNLGINAEVGFMKNAEFNPVIAG